MSQENDLDAQIVALSALLLVVDGVDSLAHKGDWPEENFLTLLPSLVRFNKDGIFAYYDQPSRLELGRQLLLRLLQKKLSAQKMAYALQLIHVETKLRKNSQLMKLLINRLSKATQQAAHFGLVHDNLMANFAAIYSDSASQAANKVMIKGSPYFLQQTKIVNRIRALLLCGVRACALWRAYGGNRWQLIWTRRGIESRAKLISFN